MSDQFLAEIRIFPFNFPPVGWAFCNGQIMPITQNTALFSLLGTNFGGDGRTTFGLPNLQGTAPMFYGQGPGLSLHDLGESGGSVTVTLLQTQLPAHTHTMNAYAGRGTNEKTATAQLVLGESQGNFVYDATPNPPLAAMAPQAISQVGGGQPHNNMMPYLTLNFCIALQGIFPARQ
jgi:microcystin-dependent protein